MRHAAEGVTDEHYADTKLIDLRGALNRLPVLPLDGKPEHQTQSATGTDDATAVADVRDLSPRPFPRQLQSDSARFDAQAVNEASASAALCGSRNPLSIKQQSESARSSAKGGEKAGDRIRTDDVQLGNA
jgi:hypothetical protein